MTRSNAEKVTTSEEHAKALITNTRKLLLRAGRFVDLVRNSECIGARFERLETPEHRLTVAQAMVYTGGSASFSAWNRLRRKQPDQTQ